MENLRKFEGRANAKPQPGRALVVKCKGDRYKFASREEAEKVEGNIASSSIVRLDCRGMQTRDSKFIPPREQGSKTSPFLPPSLSSLHPNSLPLSSFLLPLAMLAISPFATMRVVRTSLMGKGERDRWSKSNRRLRLKLSLQQQLCLSVYISTSQKKEARRVMASPSVKWVGQPSKNFHVGVQ